MRVEWLAVGRDGVALARANRDTAAKLAVLTPSHQFPLGGAMAASRRAEFINWAEAVDGFVVEDDYDSEFRYAGSPIPALAGFDTAGRTIYMGSFSKIFSASLRIGYLVVPQPLVGRFAQTLARFGGRASQMPQPALAAFMADGAFYRHIRRMRRIYGERRRHLLALLAGLPAETAWFADHQAGMQVALRLRDGVDDAALSDALREDGVAAAALSPYFACAGRQPGLLLGFCAFTPDEMDVAFAVLRGHVERIAG
jgi:GntR family transcriptional regulator/MocR family aminotransferase